KEAEIQEAMKKSGGVAKMASAKGGKKALQEAGSTARQYAHLGVDRAPEVPGLVLWEPALPLTPAGATVSFALSPNTTTYRVLLYANSPSGRLGYFQGTLRVR